MKKQKDRCTVAQFDQALTEQIEHARGMNVPINAISSAASFTLLVLARLFGDNRKMSPALTEVFTKLRADAASERIAQQQEQRRLEKEAKERERTQVIMPGTPGFRNPGSGGTGGNPGGRSN